MIKLSERQIELKCKDFDSWVSFMGRIDKVGSHYLIKNDVVIPANRNTISGSTEKIPGKHITRDPLFIDDDECYVKDGIYALICLESLKEIIKGLKETVPDCRKRIIYFRDKERIGFIMGIEKPVTVEVGKLLTGDAITENIHHTMDSITWFNDLITPIENMVDNEWTEFSSSDLVHLRNNGILEIKKQVGDRTVSTRLARSLFPLAGVVRMDTPLALGARYAFLPSEQSDVSILRIQAFYKCGQSPLTQMNCVHEYLVLIYDEED